MSFFFCNMVKSKVITGLCVFVWSSLAYKDAIKLYSCCRYEELRYWYDCLCYEEDLRQYNQYVVEYRKWEEETLHPEDVCYSDVYYIYNANLFLFSLSLSGRLVLMLLFFLKIKLLIYLYPSLFA